MRLKVNEGWEPGITWEGTTYPPGETFDIDDDAAQFLANGALRDQAWFAASDCCDGSSVPEAVA
jgi:hypothetical protein